MLANNKTANHEESYEGLFDVNTLTKTLLKYDSQEKEWLIYKFGDGEDEQNHVINDNNSYGLDYACDKHLNVINKDMLNFIVLTPYGIVFIEEQSSVEPWDGLNDILDGIASKTLLPDYQKSSKQTFINIPSWKSMRRAMAAAMLRSEMK